MWREERGKLREMMRSIQWTEVEGVEASVSSLSSSHSSKPVADDRYVLELEQASYTSLELIEIVLIGIFCIGCCTACCSVGERLFPRRHTHSVTRPRTACSDPGSGSLSVGGVAKYQRVRYSTDDTVAEEKAGYQFNGQVFHSHG